MTVALFKVHLSSQMVPHTSLMANSTLPCVEELPPAKRTLTEKKKNKIKSTTKATIRHVLGFK